MSDEEALHFPDKINAVLNFPRADHQKELHSFLGWRNTSFTCNFTFASGTPFVWSDDCETAFHELQHALTSER